MSGSRLYWQQVWTLLAHELKSEWRRRDLVPTMGVFAVVVVVVLNFALGSDPAVLQQGAAGVLWLALAFAAVIGVQRAGQLDQAEDSLHGILLALADRSALLLAKLLAQLLYLLGVGLGTVGLCGLWFQLDVRAGGAPLGVALLLGLLGLSIVGSVLGLLAGQTRGGEVVLPLLVLPLTVPVTIAAVQATTHALTGQGWGASADALVLLGGFDVIFFVVVFLVFDWVVEE
jgi:heme exporter protein B